jgi:hypothetical protein
MKILISEIDEKRGLDSSLRGEGDSVDVRIVGWGSQLQPVLAGRQGHRDRDSLEGS